MQFSNKKCLVYDHGLFLYIAQRLAEDFGEVFYFSEWESSAPLPDKDHIGYGVSGITRADTLEDVLLSEEPDLIVFPDVGHGGKQDFLRQAGDRVFGTCRGEVLEDDRVFLRKALEKLDLPVSPYQVINGGVDELRAELQKVKNKFVKVSLYRGICETFLHKNYKCSKAELNRIAHALGILDGEVEFLIEDPIESVCEVGAEWFFTDKGYLPIGMYGYEIKNKGYCGKICEYDDLPKPLKIITDKFAPLYKKYMVRGALSTEVRITKDQESYFIDPCMRFGSPPGECLSEIYENMAEIMWSVAGGDIVTPEPRFKYAAQVMLQSREAATEPMPIDIPEKYAKQVKLRCLCRIKGQYYYLPQDKETVIGAAIGLADTYEEAQEKALEAANEMEDSDLYYDKDVFEKANEQIEKAESVGMGYF